MKWLKKNRAAVALKYDKESKPSPTVTATGKGKTAEKIIDIARKSGVPIIEDPEIVEALARINVGEMIPVELYRVIAEILIWVYKQDGRIKELTPNLRLPTSDPRPSTIDPRITSPK